VVLPEKAEPRPVVLPEKAEPQGQVVPRQSARSTRIARTTISVPVSRRASAVSAWPGPRFRAPTTASLARRSSVQRPPARASGSWRTRLATTTPTATASRCAH